MESECFVVAAAVVFFCTVVAISFICLNVWLTFPNRFVFRGRRNKKWKGRGKKKKRRLVSVTRLNLTPPPPLSIGQRQTDEEVALGLFSLTKSKIKTLFQASIIDIIDSCSKLFTLNCKQTLLDTEPFLLALQ